PRCRVIRASHAAVLARELPPIGSAQQIAPIPRSADPSLIAPDLGLASKTPVAYINGHGVVQTLRQTASVQVLRHSFCEERTVMDAGRFSISPQSLYRELGTGAAPFLVDVRRDPVFEADDWMIPSAVRRSPETIEQWGRSIAAGSSIVVYCVKGHEVSR